MGATQQVLGARGQGALCADAVQADSPLLRMSGLNVIRASREVSLLTKWKKHCITLPADIEGGMGRGTGT